ncbi:D-alanyl-D-alanine carboxypeptidase/D-alanyl-D-alanine-endopeptidase (penicillin-binding protein 4) [Curtobacterium flaccumfaciens]|uniref:D-alanyl-D-alanine carboxypeptidase/D-alanyl-D-alanine-endopeptidase (Penicillin-binding protein 4) n=1 Tax=Curtobacterium flaccumfaciens TaxID=2035 RepID=A0A4R6DP40_9MICO|nr:D-alanyl-D-alanine carboxypeptidase [Curtobacterium flaccumfaciens]TDN46613.1 D-alanyl-D-alanine carboxypeptidase/D-alanyl-D-alanine-endopeptidase (penicillin-binding protein 4) [Curtobacterium flaccumfaciens]
MQKPRELLRRYPHTIAFATVLALVVGGIAVATTAIGSSRDRATAADGRCTADSLAGRWSAGRLFLDARSVRTGKAVLTVRGDEPTQTGSTMKLLTASAALSALGPDRRFTTRIVAGTTPGSVVLVGGGDPTLSRLPSGQDGVYPGAPHLDDLARQVRAAHPGPIDVVQVDTGLFDGPAWHPTWTESARTSGSVSNITALMVDGDRDDPADAYSLRSAAAVARAASAFAVLLGPDVRVDTSSVAVSSSAAPSGAAPSGATVLGSVRSATVSDLVGTLLTHSDDTLAEVLARHVAVAEGTGRSFDAIQAGTTKALRHVDVPTAGLRLVDGSGLSPDNRVPASTLTKLMRAVAEHRHGLAPVDAGLAVAGTTGTLAEHGRFTGPAADARGHVRGKTGTLDDMFGLTGVTDEVAGDRIAFTVFAEGTGDPAARKDIDALAAALWRCGGNAG